MHRVLTVALVFALMDVSSLVAGPAAQVAAASIAGTAKTPSGQPIANATVRLRSLASGQQSASTTSSATGQFNLVGLDPGNYVVEIVNTTGQILGTSAPISVAAGAAVTGVTVTAAAAVAISAIPAVAAIASATSGISTAAVVVTVAAAAGVAGFVTVKDDASRSR